MGAAWALHLASQRPEALAAVVVYYGAYAPDFSRSQAAFMGHFAETDEWEPPENMRELEAALRAAGREVEFYTYPGTVHWFSESNQPSAYQPETAQLAWERTVKFLKDHLPGTA
jgi:carboxymethylenebutenolidase